MRLDNKNWVPGDVVLFDGVEVSARDLVYADDVRGEIGRINWRDREKRLSEKRTYNVEHGRVELKLARGRGN